jgi:xylulokinase
LRTRIENLQDKIRGLAPEAEGLLLFPGLTGERSPYWKDYFSGSLVGVTAGTKPEHILRALMEGTSLRLRKLLSVMKGSGLAPARITIVGGCSQIDVWNQIKADVTGIDIVKSSISEATSLGTAMFCRVALGEARSLREAARAWAAEDERYRPNSSYAKVYAGKAALFDEYIAAADGVFRKLQARPQAAGPRLQE